MKLTQAQRSRLKSLETRTGRISARQVLVDAKKTSSPLHSLFNWNIKHAAENWWLHRARLIIGAVTYEVTHESVKLNVPGYIVDTSVKGDGYRSVVAMKTDTASARESLVYTLEVANGHLRRAFDLAGPLGLQNEINDLVTQITGLQQKAGKKAA